MNGLVIVMWLVGFGLLGSGEPGSRWLERAECHLRSVPGLLGVKPAGDGRTCPCGEVCDEDAKDEDAKDDDAKDEDVCDGCDPDERDEEEGR